MGRKIVSERNLSQAKLQMLIDYYLGDMSHRGCTQDFISTNRRTLRRFVRRSFPSSTEVKTSEIMKEVIDSYVTSLQNREYKWDNHPTRDPIPGRLSPFTIRKEIKILKGFGT
ncbi:MAG: hypothetical protein GTO14_08925 [Anaerolineales bacterium]|nr:hypothetical protein [Anaerolineales bacterium]